MAIKRLDIESNMPEVLGEIATAQTEVAQTAKQAGDAQKKAFTDGGKAATGEIKSMRQLNKEIRDLEASAIAFGEGTEEAARAITLAGKKRADLRDLKQAVDALDPDRVARGFFDLGRVGVGAFTGIQSVVALVGKENENLQKTLVRLQAAQGVLASLQELANSRDVIARLRIIALQKIQTLETQRGIVATQGATIASRLLALALTPTGIFAIVAAVAALVGAIVLYRRETELTTKAEIERSRAIDGTIIKNKELRKEYNDQLVALNEINNEYLVLLGVFSEYEAAVDNIRTKQREADQEAENNAKKRILENDNLTSSAKRYVVALLTGNLSVVEGLKAEEEAAILTELALIKKQNATEADIKIQQEQVKQLKKDLEDEAKAVEKKKQMRELEAKQAKERFDKLIKDSKFTFEKTTAAEEALANELIDINQKKLDNLVNYNAKKVIEDDATYKSLLEKIIKFYEDKAAVEERDIEREKELQAQRREAFNISGQSLQASLESVSELNSIRVENEIKQIEAVRDIDILAIEERINAANRQGANTEALEKKKQAIEEAAAKKSEALRKKEFERAKKYQIAQAIISGAVAVTNALATVPFPAGLAAAISAGIQVAFQLAKIEQQTFRKGGYTGDGSPDQEAGIVHKKEFVSTEKTTQKHRNLLEALHDNDYSGLTPMDLDPILKGTGVVINQEAVNKINKDGAIVRQMEDQKRSATEIEMRTLNKNFKRFINHQKSQETQSTLPDGSRMIKTGNTTRIIKKRNG